MKTITVIAYPYAIHTGTLNIPEEITDEQEARDYGSEHFDDINFYDLDLDYAGTEFDMHLD